MSTQGNDRNFDAPIDLLSETSAGGAPQRGNPGDRKAPAGPEARMRGNPGDRK